jgi:hypothetical protein
MQLEFFLGGRLILTLQGAEKLFAQTLEGDRWDHNKDLLLRNYVGDVSLQCCGPSNWV